MSDITATETQKITLAWVGSIVGLNFFLAGVTAYYILIGDSFWALFWLESLALGLPVLCYMAFRSIRTAHSGILQDIGEDIRRPLCIFYFSFLVIWAIGYILYSLFLTST